VGSAWISSTLQLNGRVGHASWARSAELKGLQSLAPPEAELGCRQPDRRAHRSRSSLAPGLQVVAQVAARSHKLVQAQQVGRRPIAGAPARPAPTGMRLTRAKIGRPARAVAPAAQGFGGRAGSGCCHPSARAGAVADQVAAAHLCGRFRATHAARSKALHHHRQLVETAAAGRAFPVAGCLGRGLNVQIGHRWPRGPGAGIARLSPPARRPVQAMGSAAPRWAVRRPATRPPVTPRGVRVTVTACAAAAQPPSLGNGHGPGPLREAGVGAGQLPDCLRAHQPPGQGRCWFVSSWASLPCDLQLER